MREQSTTARRHAVKASRLHSLARAQGMRCAYCGRQFHTLWRVRGKQVYLRPVADHFIPWHLTRDSSDANLLAACQVCNATKGSRLFTDMPALRAYVARYWQGARLLSVAPERSA